MAGAAMTFIAQTVGAFRTAEELSSHEPTQLRRTIEDQEARIASQDLLIERQVAKIMDLEGKLDDYKSISSNAAKGREYSSFQLLARINDLLKENKQLEGAHESLKEDFESLFEVQKELLADGLLTIQKLPATKENKEFFSRVNKQAGAIERARTTGKIRPINALRTLSDLQKEVAEFLSSRPLLTYQRSERYRAEILIDELMRDPKRKGLNTAEATRILSHSEERVIYPAQAIRAMKRAAAHHPDEVKFETRPRVKARLCKIEIKGAEP